MRKADWYFDFLSPFAYLQNCRLDEFPSNLFINRKPLLFAGLLNHWGTKGPVELSAKRLFTYRHVQWLAGQLELPFCLPEKHPFNPISLLRLCIAADCSKKAVDAIFNCVWVEDDTALKRYLPIQSTSSVSWDFTTKDFTFGDIANRKKLYKVCLFCQKLRL